MRNPKKNSEKRIGKRQVVQPNGTSWDKLEYVGEVGLEEGGLPILVGQVEQGEGGLQIFVGQVGQGQGSVHLNHSTCPKWDYKVVNLSAIGCTNNCKSNGQNSGSLKKF